MPHRLTSAVSCLAVRAPFLLRATLGVRLSPSWLRLLRAASRWDLGPYRGDYLTRFTGGMFVGDEMRLEVGFNAARAGLANLAHCGLLTSASTEAYGEGLTGVAGVAPLGSVPGVSKLVKVHFRDLLVCGDCAVLALRWEAIGPAGRLFPALDADITLVPAGPQATLLRIAGAYRPPLGFLGAGFDRAVLHRVATATIRDFISRVADSIGPGPAPARTPENDETRPAETGGLASGGAAPGAS